MILSKEFIDCKLKFEKGYEFNPKSKLLAINKIEVFNKQLTTNIIKRKIKIKLDYYFNYLLTEVEEDTEDNKSFILNGLELYKDFIINYKPYIDNKYLNLVSKKLDLVSFNIASKLQLEVKTR